MQNIIFGAGAVKKLPAILGSQGIKSVMLVTDASLVKLGFADVVAQALDKGKISYQVFSDIEANPSIETVNKAHEEFLKSHAQAVIAFGGGSPMDVAKAAATLATYGGKVTDYEGLCKVPGKILPIVAIPTTAGTGSEVTASAVITDHSRHFKFSIMSPEIIPSCAILDPDFILSLPEQVAASTGVDAIIHAIESYISLDATPFTEAMAEKALDLLGGNIRAFVADRGNAEAASAMLLGSNFAGIAFARSKLGDVHAMAHPLGGYFNIPHGVANAVLLSTVLDFNKDFVEEKKYERIYHSIFGVPCGPFKKDMLITAVRNLCRELNIPENLTQLKVDPALIPAMAVDAMKSGNVCVNPRPTTVLDMEELFRRAM